METSSIFCAGCPVRSRCSPHESDQPAAIGGNSTRVNATTARHHLGSSEPAARFHMVDKDGQVLEDRAASVVAPAGLTNDEVSAYFEVCTEPNKNVYTKEYTLGSRRFNLSISLGKSCAALAAIENSAKYPMSRQHFES